MDIRQLKLDIIKAAEKAVTELIKVANEAIIKKSMDELSPDIAADRLKNAAASKKLAIFDAFEILTRIESERAMLDDSSKDKKKMSNFAERKAK